MKPAEFIASALDDISAMPDEVKRVFGFALRLAQRGEKHPDAKPLKGFGGAGVLEVVEDYDGDTYRAIYTVSRKHRVRARCFPEEIKTRKQDGKT